MRLRNLPIALAALSALCACASVEADNSLAGDFLSGRFAERRNAIENAADAYARASASAPQQVEILRDAFFFHLASGDVDGAALYARDLVSIGDGADDGLARLTLAAKAIKEDRLKQSRALLNEEPGVRFMKSVFFLTGVWVEDGLSGPGAALARLENPGADVFGGFSALHKGLLSEKAGLIDDARTAFEVAAFGVGDPIGRIALGPFLERTDPAAAREYYGLLGGDYGPARREAELGLRRLRKGRPSGAFRETTPAEGAAFAFYAFAGAITQQAADERARAEEAGFNVGEPRYNYPLALARLALYLKPDFDEARRLVGTILNIYGEYEAAAEVLAAIPPSSPHYEQARIDIASGLLARDERNAALRILKEAIRRDPGGDELKWSLANLQAQDGDHGGAVETLDAVIGALGAAPEKGAWRFYVSRAASLIELGRWSDAEADLKRAVELAPEEPAALNYLGYSWVERGINLQEAFDLIEKAVALEPHSGAIIDSLGWAHYQLRQYDEAVPYLEQAAALEPGDPTITDHLGDVYWRLGRKVEARYQWRRALELEPGEKLEKSLRAKLESGLDAPEGESRANDG